jgi:integrase
LNTASVPAAFSDRCHDVHYRRRTPRISARPHVDIRTGGAGLRVEILHLPTAPYLATRSPRRIPRSSDRSVRRIREGSVTRSRNAGCARGRYASSKAKRATANTQRAIEFDRERLDVVKRVLGDVKLSSITPRTIEGFQAKRRVEGASNRTVNMDIGALRQVMKRFKQWRRLEDDVKMLTESGGEPIGRVLTSEEQERLFKTAEANPEWEHVYCAAILAANTSMRGVEVKNVRRKDFDAEKRVVHIRASKNETSKRVIPLNDSAFDAVQRMVRRADLLGHSEPTHYLWCASQHHKLDATKPASKWDTAWRALRDAAGLPGLRFHDLRHTVVTRLLEAGEPDHVVESITGHLSRRMLEHYSHIRLHAKKQALDRLDRSGTAARAKTAK